MKKILFVMFYFFAFTFIYAQQKFNFEFDFAQFAYDSTSNFVELYYSFDQNNLSVQKLDTITFSAGRIRVNIVDSLTNKSVFQKEYRVTNIITDQNTVDNKLLVSKIGFVLAKGNYVIYIIGRDDLDSTRAKLLGEKIKIRPFMNHDISVSDIELAKSIKSDNVNIESIFYKNTLEVIPNPTILFSSSAPIMYYYAEMYNLNVQDTTKPLLLNRILYNSRGKEINRKSKVIYRDKQSLVEVGLINLIKYPTDNYNLVLSLLDSVNNKMIFSNKKFFYYNPNFKDTTLAAASNYGFMSSEFGVFSDEECDDVFDKSKYIATEREIKQYQKLDSLNTKRDFLYRFWKSRDLEPETEKFEFKDQYFARVEYCNNKYSSFNKKGYKTDRGRVYLILGEPDQVDMYPNETDKKPYEVWYYNTIEGGVLFVFGDLTGYNDYELLSSTKRGEIRDDNWTRRITTN
ncbi:MAG: GWxTD domain-containing protein [bacterium]